MAEESTFQQFCTNCGTQLIQGADFCPSCGTRARGRDAEAGGVGLDYGGGPVFVQFLGTGLQLLVRGIFAVILMILIIPYGWGVSLLSGWYVNNLAFSDGRTANFTGRGSQIWYYIFLLLLTIFLNIIPLIGGILGWLVSMRIELALTRWFFGHIQLSTGQTLRFDGSYWPFVGWNLLWAVSFITIIGWAWVASAWMRWLCENVDIGQENLEFVGAAWSSYGAELPRCWAVS